MQLFINSSKSHPSYSSIKAKELLHTLLERAGIQINGDNPWDPQILDEGFYHRVLVDGSLGLGESYMEQWWECKELDEFTNRALLLDLRKEVGTSYRFILTWLSAQLINMQTRIRSKKVAHIHYNLLS